MKDEDYGYAARELFVQFMARIAKEMPTATLAMFSTLKYVNASNFTDFRDNWNAKYLGGFIVHSKAFDGLNGNFPIGFLVWKIDQKTKQKTPITEVMTEIIDRDGNPIGDKKFFNIDTDGYLNKWLPRLKTDTQNIPLKNAVTPQNNHAKVTAWRSDAIGYFWCNGNDMQQANQTSLFSSVFSAGNGFYVTPENLWQAAVVFSVRRLIKPTWVNDRDQFLQPTKPLSDDFKNDCLIWMLFNGSNLTASADGLEWNGKQWSIVNHFIPFTENQVGAQARFESEFMVQYLSDKKLSPESLAVLNAGQDLWAAYFVKTPPRVVRDELKLNRPDVGWYQIRNALKKRNDAGDDLPVDFGVFESAYMALSEKLRPQVFELGFLRE